MELTMSTNRDDDPEYWRARAADVRKMACRLCRPDLMHKALEIANTYEEIAGSVEQRLGNAGQTKRQSGRKRTTERKRQRS
jgi:hypothetical protein